MMLLPHPREEKLSGGKGFALTAGCHIAVHPSCGKEALFWAELLRREISDDLGLDLLVEQGEAGDDCIFLCGEEALPAEGYRLTVTPDGVVISGHGAGLLYGIQTLRQLVRCCGEGGSLPAAEISDYPALPNRGFYHDVTRGRVPTLDFLKKLADTCAFYKLNQLQLYVEHSFLFPGERVVGTPLTADEIRELDAYCCGLCIELVPSLASFGHLYELLRTPKFAYCCELPGAETAPFSFSDRMEHHTVAMCEEDSFSLVSGRIAQYMELFSSDKFNICADETFDLCTGKSAEYGRKNGVSIAYCEFLKRLCDFVAAKGKTPMFWGDYLLKNPAFVTELPADSVVLDWNYAPDADDGSVKKFLKNGVKNLYLCPGIQGWNHLIYQHRDAYNNVSRMCAYAHKYHAAGVLNTDWGDYGHINPPECAVQGLIYGAALSWSDRPLGEDELNRQLSAVEYGDFSGQLAEIFAEMSEQELFRWYTAVRYKEKMTDAQRKKCRREVKSGQVERANLRLEELERRVAAIAGEYPRCAEVAEISVLMSRGQRLLNRLPVALEQGEPAENAALAGEIARWFGEYTVRWNKVSKPSELFRMEEVIRFFTDLLEKKSESALTM